MLATQGAASTLVKERVIIARHAIMADPNTSVKRFCIAPPLAG
jgi:hypothetical protein